jgi:hypothetical protein
MAVFTVIKRSIRLKLLLISVSRPRSYWQFTSDNLSFATLGNLKGHVYPALWCSVGLWNQ